MTSAFAVDIRALLCAAAILACGASAASVAPSGSGDAAEESAAEAAPAAAAAPVFAPRPEHVVVSDAKSSPGKLWRAKGYKLPARGGAVLLDAAGDRLEIAPVRRPTPAAPAFEAAQSRALPALPVLDDPKGGLGERRRRAQLLLGGSAAAAVLLVLWARRRWRPDL